MRFSPGTYTSYGSWYQLYPELLHTSSMWIQPGCSCYLSSNPIRVHVFQCRNRIQPIYSIGFFIAPLLFDTVINFMTISKAFNIRRRNGGPNSRLIQTFLREGVCYYILISIANLINSVFLPPTSSGYFSYQHPIERDARTSIDYV